MASLQVITGVDDLLRLAPTDRFLALINAGGVPSQFRQEPITFEKDDPIFGWACGVGGCERPSAGSAAWCSRHLLERADALRSGTGEAAWRAAAAPLRPPTQIRGDVPRSTCRICPDRDAVLRGTGDLCSMHAASYRRNVKAAGPDFDPLEWTARQRPYPGAGPCRVPVCPDRADYQPALCPRHRQAWRNAGYPAGDAFERWLPEVVGPPQMGVVHLGDMPPLLAAEIRYGLWAHTKNTSPARWSPTVLRRLIRSCSDAGVGSLLELDPNDREWTVMPAEVNRTVRELLKDVGPVHQSRADIRNAGFIDTTYWGFRFSDRRSPFDLTAIAQRWLRDFGWDYLADLSDSPRRPRTSGTFEQIRRSLVCFSAYLTDCVADGGMRPAALSEATAKEFVADFTRRVADGQPVRGMFNVDGSPSTATQLSYSITMNGLRRVMRWAMDSGAAAAAHVPRDFIVAIPFGGAQSVKNPRPFSDAVLRALSDPANIRLLDAADRDDRGLADIWSIQVRCGRRISEVVQLRFDCVSEHLGRTWIWVDMTKVGQLDYAVQIPRDIYDLVRRRQAKTRERFRLMHGLDPTAKQGRSIALFPSRRTNPSFERSLSPSKFTVEFKAWIESEEMQLPGHTTHQARHTLATRLVEAGASMTHVKRVLGHVSERMSDSYVLIAGTQIEPFLQQVWVTGPGNATPGKVVLTPTDAERSNAEKLMVDLAALPTEHGLCTFKPVVGGFDCPFGRQCNSCEHFVITGADYGYWRRQEERWAAMAEGAPDETAREYIYGAFERSSLAIAGLEKALLALGLLDQANALDLRNPHQDFFDPIWRQGWRAGDLVQLGSGDHGDAEDGEEAAS